MKVKEAILHLQDRQGNFEVVDAKFAQQLEDQLEKAKDVLKQMAIRLIPEPGVSMVQTLDVYLADAHILDLIDDFGLCVTHHRGKAKIDKGQEWAVQTDDYSELIERPTIEEAVNTIVEKIRKTLPTVYVDSLLTKKD